MLSYRHAFHAGNFADVVKHLVLVGLIDALQAKPGGLTIMDTHAGAGAYRLDDDRALQTGEAAAGIGALRGTPAEPDSMLARYLTLCDRWAEDHPAAYPGSPALIAQLLRPQDRLIACELHPEDHAILKARFRGNPQVAVHRRDGFEAVRALLPPQGSPRGLLFMDPAYETAGEFERVAAAVLEAHRRWRAGVQAIWYPLLARKPATALLNAVRQAGLPNTMVAELALLPADAPLGMTGCAMLLVNTPWPVQQNIAAWLQTLHSRLSPGGEGGSRVEIL